MTYNQVLTSNEARNCGLYLVYYKNNVIYIGRAASITLKRRLAEHLSYDNQFNTLTRKTAKYFDLNLNNINLVFSFIIKEFQFELIPFDVHSYDMNGNYSFNKENQEAIKIREKELIRENSPVLNKRNI